MKVLMPAKAGWWPRLNREMLRSITESAASSPSFKERRTSSSCFFCEMRVSVLIVLAPCVSPRLTPWEWPRCPPFFPPALLDSSGRGFKDIAPGQAREPDRILQYLSLMKLMLHRQKRSQVLRPHNGF